MLLCQPLLREAVEYVNIAKRKRVNRRARYIIWRELYALVR